jgi:anti-sigma-K factor RskA
LKHERSTGEIQETAALYALGSLSQHDARAFENHLKEGCGVCGAEVRRFERIVGLLGLTATEAEPPVYLRELLVAHVELGEKEATRHAPEQPEQKAPAQSAQRSHRSLSAWSRVLSWAMAAGCAVLAAYSYYSWKQSDQSVQERTAELVAARSDAEQLSKMLELERGRSRELEHINAILERPGARILLLSGTDSSSPASVAIFWDVGRRRWLVTGRLPQAAEGKVYQLWYVTKAGRFSAGILQQDSQGHVFSVLDGPEVGIEIKEAAITLEPAGGSAQPTWPLVASSGK